MKKTLFSTFVLLTGLATAAFAQDQTTTYNKEKLQQDYRAFLKQLKEMNTQYKEITGEIGQVMKEEGTPTWDMGEGAPLLGDDKPKEATLLIPEPGITIKDADQQMTVTLDMPGIQKGTLKIALQDGKKLTVSANRWTVNENKKVEKEVHLPSTVDPKGSRATYEDGVLTVTLPKTASKDVAIPVR